MNRLLIALIVFCASIPTLTCAQNENKIIDTVKVNTFFEENFIRSALEYQEVYKYANRLFKKGKIVNRSHLESKFYPKGFLAVDSAESNTIRYRLFAGSNGIIGKDIMLYVNRHGKVKELEIRDFGR